MYVVLQFDTILIASHPSFSFLLSQRYRYARPSPSNSDTATGVKENQLAGGFGAYSLAMVLAAGYELTSGFSHSSQPFSPHNQG